MGRARRVGEALEATEGKGRVGGGRGQGGDVEGRGMMCWLCQPACGRRGDGGYGLLQRARRGRITSLSSGLARPMGVTGVAGAAWHDLARMHPPRNAEKPRAM